MANYTSEDILTMDSGFRRNFMNTLAGFKSANLIGTEHNGNTNAAIFNSVVHLGANPPLMGFILRPLTVPRHTYTNLKNTGYYTFNHVNINCVDAAHQTSAKYEEDSSEFEQVGLTMEYTQHPAPYVKESQIQVGLKYKEEYLIAANDTVLIVGEVLEVNLKGEFTSEDGFINLDEANTVAISGLDGYYQAKKIRRLAYARPKTEPMEIDT